MARVTAVMITQLSRATLATESARCFAAQDWPDKELMVVIDDINTERATMCAALIDNLRSIARDQIQVYTIPSKCSLGYLRNLSLKLAASPYVIQWDDDDLYHPARISVQIQPVLEGKAIGTCLVDQLYYMQPSNVLAWIDWRNRHPRSNLIPGTLLVKRSHVPSNPCAVAGPSSRRGEDGDLLRAAMTTGQVDGIYNKGWCYLRRYHGTNTWDAKHFSYNIQTLGQRTDVLFPKLGLLRDVLPGYGVDLPVSLLPGHREPPILLTP